jgi:cytochrome c peroxidase
MRYPKTTATILSIATCCLLITVACKKSETVSIDPAVSSVLNIPATAFNYANQAIPAYLQAPPIVGQINTPATNPITDNGATLGRVLFYDKNLSLNNTVSCASCHKQDLGFADATALSKGFAGGNTGRNSMGLANAKYYPNGKFFWDERAATLEAQTLMPIQDHTEMGMTLDSLEKKLSKLAYYSSLFNNAFGSSTITSDKISKALSQYVRSIVSYQSKYDEGRKTFAANVAPGGAANFPNFTAEENRGKELFFSPQNACAACHGTETFTGLDARNNGLDVATTDAGVGAITGNVNLNGTFKVNSLKNIELTAPYMHDGRFATLEQVVEHYNSGVKPHPNLSNVLKDPLGNPRRLNLSAADKAALVAFLKTLTDQKLCTDEKFSNPFK